jgi:hypothetical protein
MIKKLLNFFTFKKEAPQSWLDYCNANPSYAGARIYDV